MRVLLKRKTWNIGQLISCQGEGITLIVLCIMEDTGHREYSVLKNMIYDIILDLKLDDEVYGFKL